jgi:hypothetical protein
LDLKQVVRKLLSLSKDYPEGDEEKREHHQRYVNFTLIHVRSLSMLQYLVEEEHADVNYIDPEGEWTVLYAIVKYNGLNLTTVLAMIRYLYEETSFHLTDHMMLWELDPHNMFKVDIVSTALRYVMQFNYPSYMLLVDLLLYYGYGYTMTFTLNVADDTARVDRSVCENIEELRLENGTMNPLLYAAVWQSKVMIKHVLVQHKANVNARDSKGNTALMYIVQQTRWEDVVGELIDEYKADPYIMNHDGQTALTLATDVNRRIIERRIQSKPREI